MYSSQKSAQKRSIMDYLPEQQKAKIRKLVERLAEQTQEKQKFQRLYEQMKKKYDEVCSRCSELQQYNNDLKTQIATSRMAINKAKEVYNASKSAKKIRRNDREDTAEKDPIPSSHLKQLWSKIPRSGEAKQTKNEYMFEEGENENNLHTYQKTVSKRTFETPGGGGQKKYLRMQTVKQPILQTNTSLQNLNAYSNSKKQQILNLRKQIESLTQEMKKKSHANLPLNDKIQKCEEIKRRYLKSKEKLRQNEEESSEQQSVSEDEPEKNQKGKIFLQVVDLNEQKKREKDLQKMLSETLKEKQRQKIEREREIYKKSMRQNLEQQQYYIEQNQESKYSKTHSRNSSHINSHINKTKKNRFKKQQDSGTSRNKTSLEQLSQYRYNKQGRSPHQQKRKLEDNQNFAEKNRRQTKKGQFQTKFDQSLFAIIDQLNSGG